MPSADYIIVDEIQDFELKEIQEFMNTAKSIFYSSVTQLSPSILVLVKRLSLLKQFQN